MKMTIIKIYKFVSRFCQKVTRITRIYTKYKKNI